MNKRFYVEGFSKAFEMSRNTPLTSIVGLLSNAVYISLQLRAIHESPGRKPDCKEIKSLFLENDWIENYRLLFQKFY